MKKTMLVIAAVLMLFTVAAIAGNGNQTEKAKLGPCVKQCVQAYNPSIEDSGADEIAIEAFNARECVEACKAGTFNGSCATGTDNCCSGVSYDPDCGIELPGLGDPCDPNVGCQAPYQCLPDELGDYFCSP